MASSGYAYGQQVSYIPGTDVTFIRSSRYIGRQADVANITQLFQSLCWPATTVTVYITNGWHESWEDRNGHFTQVTYCGYCVNYDIDTYKQHYYLN